MASDPSLAPFEKVGFAAVHRQESEQNIFRTFCPNFPF